MHFSVSCDTLEVKLSFPVWHEREKEMKLPQNNTPDAGLTTLPDLIQWHQDLKGLHTRLASHFARPEPHARALRYVQGILSTVERKNG